MDDREKLITIKSSISIFFFKDKLRIILIVITQFLLGCIDLLAVVVIGLLSSIAVTGIQSEDAGTFQNKLLMLLHLKNLRFQTQVALLGSLAALLMVARTFSTVYVVKRNLRYLVNKTIQISSVLIDHVLRKDYLDLNKKTIQENTYLITDSVRNVSVGIIGTILNMSSDIILTAILIIGLTLTDPIMTISMFFVMGFVLVIMSKKMQRKAFNLGVEYRILTTNLRSKIAEAIRSYREILVKNRQDFYIQNINSLQQKMAKNGLETAFLPYLSKYVIETIVVLFAIFIAAYQFSVGTASHAIATLSMFLAASTRITPALLRIQQAFTILKLNIGTSHETLELINTLEIRNKFIHDEVISYKKRDFERNIFARDKKIVQELNVSFKNVGFKYPETDDYLFRNFTTSFNQGSLIGIVGPSGAGKTTLVDLMLGIILPTEGNVFIAGIPARQALSTFPGMMSYVTQDFYILDGTIRENLEMGFPPNTFTDQHLFNILDMASLGDFVRSNSQGLMALVRDNGTNLSGGQRQRLNLARSLVTLPRLLVLDEATSALDSKTEFEITSTVLKLKKNLSVVMIAHRLATLREFDKIIYVSKEIEVGNFEELKEKNLEFREQARLLGL